MGAARDLFCGLVWVNGSYNIRTRHGGRERAVVDLGESCAIRHASASNYTYYAGCKWPMADDVARG
eukprot:585876-Prymnesium_polylepis.1